MNGILDESPKEENKKLKKFLVIISFLVLFLWECAVTYYWSNPGINLIENYLLDVERLGAYLLSGAIFLIVSYGTVEFLTQEDTFDIKI
jgi:hypothetical protein